MPTLYDNFERVRQYIDQQTGGSIDLSSYVTKDELSAQSYLTSIPSEYITQAELSANSYLTQHQDLSSYVTKDELSAQSYLTQHQDLSGYVSKSELSAQSYLTSIPSEYITQAELSANSYLTEHQSLANYPTYAAISNMGYVTSSTLNSYLIVPSTIVSSPTVPYTFYRQGLAANNQYHFIYPNSISYANTISTDANAWASVGTVRNYVNGRIAEIEASYITSSDVSAMGYITMGDVSACGYITSIPNTYASYTGVYSYLLELGISKKAWGCYIDSTYITDSELSGDIVINGISTFQLPTYAAISEMGYATTTDLNNHLKYLSTLQEHYTNSEHFLPKTNNTYYLGNNNFKWQLTYTYNLYSSNIYSDKTYIGDINYLYNVSGGGLIVNRNGTNICAFLGGGNIGISPTTNKGASLGNSGQMWNRIYAYTAYLQDTTYLPINTYWYDGTSYHWLGDLFN